MSNERPRTLGQLRGEVDLDLLPKVPALPNMQDVQRDLCEHGYRSLTQFRFGDDNIGTLWINLNGDELLTICRKAVKYRESEHRATEIWRLSAVTPAYVLSTLFGEENDDN